MPDQLDAKYKFQCDHSPHYGQWRSLLLSCLGTDRRRGNERLGAGVYRCFSRRLRHNISAAGPEIPSKKRPLGSSPMQGAPRNLATDSTGVRSTAP
jgi:hypothetical protein